MNDLSLDRFFRSDNIINVVVSVVVKTVSNPFTNNRNQTHACL